MKRDPFTPVKLEVLNLCEDGDEAYKFKYFKCYILGTAHQVDYMDLFVRGFPVPPRKKFDRVKIKATEKDVTWPCRSNRKGDGMI